MKVTEGENMKYKNEMRGTKVLCNTGQTLILPAKKIIIAESYVDNVSCEFLRGEKLDGFYWHVRWNGNYFYGVEIEAENDEQAILAYEHLKAKKYGDGGPIASPGAPIEMDYVAERYPSSVPVHVAFDKLAGEHIEILVELAKQRWE